MKKILVNGGLPLVGEVTVSGSKNAALPILFASIITRGVSKLRRLPDIGDVRVALEILRDLGAGIYRSGDDVYIDTERLEYKLPKEDLVSKIRASTYLIGAELSRFGRCEIGGYGGCAFSYRPIDMHLAACVALGGVIEGERISAERLVGTKIDFDKPSVGATVNTIIMAASAEGETVITGHAREPHINALIEYLISAGADITLTEREIRIVGRPLHGGEITVVGDMIEAGTYLAAGLITNGDLQVKGIPPDQLSSLSSVLSVLGTELVQRADTITARHRDIAHYATVVAEPYPGFPTDLQPIIAPLLASLRGGEIWDRVWPSRFGYLSALANFGLEYTKRAGGAVIKASRIFASEAQAPDLRGGAACLLAALSAGGQSVIYSADVILRGYENLILKLHSLGADIKIEEDGA